MSVMQAYDVILLEDYTTSGSSIINKPLFRMHHSSKHSLKSPKTWQSMSAKVIGIPNFTMGVRIFIVFELHCSAAPLLQHRPFHSRSLSSEPAPSLAVS